MEVVAAEISTSDCDELQKRYLADLKAYRDSEDKRLEAKFESEKIRINDHLQYLGLQKEKAERKLMEINATILDEREQLLQINKDHDVAVHTLSVERNKLNQDLLGYIKKMRIEGVLDPEFVKQMRAVGTWKDEPTNGHADDDPPVNVAEIHAEAELTGAVVCDADGKAIGPVRKIPFNNTSTEILLDLPVKRKVKIRGGRKFTPSHLDVIYDGGGDGRFTKWIACMIQATGTVQYQRCAYCLKNQGTFEKCVIVGGEVFPRCGNCEWSRYGCHGASNNTGDVAEESDDFGSPPSRSATLSQGGANGAHYKNGPGDQSPPSDYDILELMNPKITLQHNGVVYDYPESMVGVPVEKIDKNHPYWERNWKDPVESTKYVLSSYQEKHDAAVRGTSASPAYTKFLLGRQVRRGLSILKFLEEGDFSPYQLLSRKYMASGIVTYDTLFRLVNTLEELEKFKINVSPTDWLRQRLHEIIVEQGPRFNLLKVIKDFYHDPKLTALRSASGFGNIGRPSGGGKRRSSSEKKRKESTPGTPTPTPPPNSHKRQKLADTPQPEASGDLTRDADEDLAFDGYTDTESTCGEPLEMSDFRVQQLKTNEWATSPDFTQYWGFCADIGDVEHQLLAPSDAPTDPASWVKYSPPIDFDFPIHDAKSITYHPDSLRVVVELQPTEDSTPRSDLLAAFKRERTKRRFLELCREKNKKLVKAPSAQTVEDRWASVKPKLLTELEGAG